MLGNTGLSGNSALAFYSKNIEVGRFDPTGKFGIGTDVPTATIDVNSDIIRVRASKTPSSSTAAGNAGDICWDADYIYICVAANTWKRSALSTW
jgi:hypothetical protein